MHKNEWFPERFSGLAIEKWILKNSYQPTIEQSIYINFFSAATFSSPFYLQMHCHGKTLYISRSILERQELEEEKEYVLVEEAAISGTLVNQLLHLIKTTACPIFSTDENDVVWRDGTQLELCVGRGFHETTFSWWPEIDPVDWAALDVVVQKIVQIDKQAKYTVLTKQYFELVMEETDPSLITTKEKSLLVTYKEAGKEDL